MRSFTITAADACGNVSAASTVAYTWTDDTTPPTITSVPTSGLALGCNPAAASLPTDASVQGQVTATDNCAGTPVITVSHSDAPAGCVRSEERRVGKEGRSRWWPDH